MKSIRDTASAFLGSGISSITAAIQVRNRSTARSASADARDRALPRGALVVSFVVLGWSFVELVDLSLTHTTGPELYGVLAAALATGAGVANLALLRSSRARLLVIAAVLVVWTVVAVGGIAGTVAHVLGSPIGEGPIDPRPRPITAPLIFTAFGVFGGAALLYGQRTALRDRRNPWKE